MKGGKKKTEYPIEIRNEIYSRINSFFGEENFNKIQSSFVIVVGIGGVGSHAANMLVRSGVQRIRIIDFDQVSLSSLNRHGVAVMEDVGKPKTEVTQSRLESIIPWANIEIVTELFRADNAERSLSGNPDYVLDCIDDISTKADLISYCVKNNIRILSSLGAGGKADPTRMRIAPLSDCINDPLASKIKWKLKKYGVQAEQVMAVFSIEKTVSELLPLDEEQVNNPQDFGVVDYMRVRVVPVLGTSPSIFGQSMASYVLCQLAESSYEPEAVEKLSRNLKHKMKQHFRNDELKRFGTLDQIDIDDDDIDFIVRQVWKSRCAVTNRKFGGHSALALTRWDESKDPTPYNLVLMLPEEVLKIGDSGKAHLSASVVESINSRLKWAQTVYAEDFTYAKGAYKMQTKTVYLPIQDNQNRNVQRIHTTNAKSIVVLAQVTSLFLAMAFLKNSFV